MMSLFCYDVITGCCLMKGVHWPAWNVSWAIYS
jgi:hypothetical protein